MFWPHSTVPLGVGSHLCNQAEAQAPAICDCASSSSMINWWNRKDRGGSTWLVDTGKDYISPHTPFSQSSGQQSTLCLSAQNKEKRGSLNGW